MISRLARQDLQQVVEPVNIVDPADVLDILPHIGCMDVPQKSLFCFHVGLEGDAGVASEREIFLKTTGEMMGDEGKGIIPFSRQDVQDAARGPLDLPDGFVGECKKFLETQGVQFQNNLPSR